MSNVAGPGGDARACYGCRLKWFRLRGSVFADLLAKKDIPRRWCEEETGWIHVTNIRNIPFLSDDDRRAALEVVAEISGQRAAEELVEEWAVTRPDR